MPKRTSTASKRLDSNQLAHRIMRIATGEPVPDLKRPRRKNPAAVSLGRRGGLKGGKARAAALSPERRSEIAKKAAVARWKDKP
jgi:hypothetical protein